MSRKINSRSWRNGNVYIDALTGVPVSDNKQRRKNSSTKVSFFNCEKYICINKETGKKTCGVYFVNSGRMYIGDDVWRLSYKLDICEYPYRKYRSKNIARVEYDFDEPASTLWIYNKKEVTA